MKSDLLINMLIWCLPVIALICAYYAKNWYIVRARYDLFKTQCKLMQLRRKAKELRDVIDELNDAFKNAEACKDCPHFKRHIQKTK